MSEIREKLKPYLSSRVNVRGTLTKFDSTWKTGHKYTGRACIINPEIDGEVVCQHVWVVDAPHWNEYRELIGSQVTFDAVVQKYNDRKSGETNYCLGQASEPIFLYQPPALRIPNPIEDEETCESVVVVAPVESSAPAAHDITREKIRQVKVFANACGGFAKAEEIVQALPNMPKYELLEYISLLKD